MEATKVAPTQKLMVLATAEKGASFEEALKLAEGRRILSNSDWDKILVGSDKWQEYREALPVWTGTVGAYAEPGKKLGKQVEFTDPETKEAWVFPVPEKWQDETNAMLKVEHPHYKVETDGNRRIIRVDDEANISLVKDLPTENGWRRTRDGIPCEEAVDSSDPDTRYLYRADQMVGPVARGFIGYGDRRDVFLRYGPSMRLGVVAEGVADEASQPEKLTAERKDDGTLVLTGSKEEIDAIVKQLNMG